MAKKFLKASIYISLLIILNGCSEQKKENLLIDKAISMNLIISNEQNSRNTNDMIQTFRNYSDNPAFSQKTNSMLENMELVRKVTTSTIEYLNELKRSIKIEAGLRLINMKETFNENDFSAVKNIFKNKKKGIELYEHLVNYQTSILQINPQLFVSFRSPYYFFDFFSTPTEKLEKEFTNVYFDNINTTSALAVITKFENDVRIYENRAVSFFFKKPALHYPIK